MTWSIEKDFSFWNCWLKVNKFSCLFGISHLFISPCSLIHLKLFYPFLSLKSFILNLIPIFRSIIKTLNLFLLRINNPGCCCWIIISFYRNKLEIISFLWLCCKHQQVLKYIYSLEVFDICISLSAFWCQSFFFMNLHVHKQLEDRMHLQHFLSILYNID